jgi:hypothetical protein
MKSIKFLLWDFARRHPILGRPIRFLAKIATRNFDGSYRRQLKRHKTALLPTDRYERPLECPTQVFIVTDQDADPDDLAGARLLLNHLRIPYRFVELEHSPAPSFPMTDGSILLLLCDRPWQALSRLQSFGPSCKVLCVDAEEWPHTNMDRHLYHLQARFKDLLPWNQGLLSPLAASVVRLLMDAATIPLFTGMLPARVALRLDDIAGRRFNDYLLPILKNGWKPNLGLFTDDVARADSGVRKVLADQSREGWLETSPHAFSANDFIFFDFPHGRPWNEGEFLNRWNRVKRQFQDWSLPLSPVLNVHFHALSRVCLPVLAEEGIRFHYSELALDQTGVAPGPQCLPSGDPMAATGSLGNKDFLQIYSGHSTLNCNQPASLYDFLMHVKLSNQPLQSVERLLERLRLTLHCGFASFVTTHEYLLAGLPRPIQQTLWDQVNSGLSSLFPGSVQKISMGELGRHCSDHTVTIVESVRQAGSGRWTVQLSGSSSGTSCLVVFEKGRCREIPIPAFETAHRMDITL